MSDQIYELAMEFIDGSPSFCHGFELGILWEQFKSGEPIHQAIHTDNFDQFVMMTNHYKREYEFEDLIEGWVTINVK